MKCFNSIPIKVGFFLFIAIVSLLLSCSENDTKNKTENDLKKEKLKGRIKKLIETSYDAGDLKFGEIQKGNIVQTFTYLFNENGNKVEYTMNNPYSPKYFKWTYKYNDRGSMVEEYYFDPDFNLPTAKQTYKYDSRNNLIEHIYYDKEGIISWKIGCKYDGERNRIETDHFTDEGGLSRKTICKFEDGKMIEECDYGANGSMWGKTTYMYNDKGNQIEESRFDSDGQLYYKFTTKYTENNLISETSMLNQRLPYEGLNNLTITKFNNKGNIIEEDKYSLDGKLQTKYIYKYPKYDKEENWLIQETIREACFIELADAYPNSIHEREIEYY